MANVQRSGTAPAGATVSVYLRGTTTLATIFSDIGGTPKSNPFSAGAGAYTYFIDSAAQPYDAYGTSGAAAAARVRQAVIAGGAAGNRTVTGIALGDVLLGVTRFIGAGVTVTDVTDLTSEFTITAANTINNTGGTNTTGDKLLVLWLDQT